MVASGEVLFQQNHFYDNLTPFAVDRPEDLAQLSLSGQAVVIDNIFENNQNINLFNESLFRRSVLLDSGSFLFENNVFQGFDLAILGKTLFGDIDTQLTNNTFAKNKIAIEFSKNPIGIQNFNMESNQFLNNDCAILISSEQEFVEITGLANTFEANEHNICPEDFLLPEGFME